MIVISKYLSLFIKKGNFLVLSLISSFRKRRTPDAFQAIDNRQKFKQHHLEYYKYKPIRTKKLVHNSRNLNFKRIVENIKEGIAIIDSSSKLIFINQNMAVKVGYTPAEVINRNIEEFFDEEGIRILKKHEIYHQQGISKPYDNKIKCKDGSELWVSITPTPIYNPKGEYVGCLGTLTDIHCRKLSEIHLQILSAALETINDSVLIINRQGTIIWSNPAFTKTTGYTHHEVYGKDIEFYLGDMTEDNRRQFYHNIRLSRSWQWEVMNKKKDGSEYEEELTITPIRSPAHENRYFAIVKHDLSEQRRVEQAQQQLLERSKKLAIVETRNRLSRHLHDSVSQLIYSMTILAETGQRLIEKHDLPMLLENQKYINQVSRQALREIRLLVYELRPQELEKYGLVVALQHRLDSVERRAGIESHFSAHITAPLPEAVEQEIFLIAQEALNNVVKHSGAEQVIVTLTSDESWLNLSIHDNGVGIDPNFNDFGGLGIISMKERSAQIDAEFEISQTQDGHGTEIRVRAPLLKMI